MSLPDSKPSPGIAAWRCEFQHSADEQAFLRHHLATTHGQLRVTLVICTLVYLGFNITDIVWLGYSSQTALLAGVRVAVAIAAMGGILMLRRWPDSIGTTQLVASMAELAGGAGFLLITALRSEEFALHAISMAIIIIVFYIYIPNRLLYSAPIAALSTLGFVLLAAGLGNLRPVELGTIATMLALTNLFGYVAAARYQLLLRHEYTAQNVLKNLSVRDPLTGCYNRRYLHQQLLETEISRAQRYQLSLTVIMCDLDHFKLVNDRYGHHGGDAVLQHFARLMQALTRDGIDSVVRYGGEEFLLILPETDLAGGELLAQRLRLALSAQPIAYGDQEISATASFGVASINFAQCSSSAHTNMITAADDMLYAAKNSGRNRVCSRQLG
ncbi:GGDEF domain-containing protein [Duganella fentianensis]|uniref:GGDEF domain-containing protein n=1 Tax=Duganella fentianensis TaxID=2692177 RepID=UPI0032B221F6